MPKRCYVPKKFSPANAAVIDKANEIVEEYAAQGFILTLRQLYYQFVARGLLPNHQRSYKRLGAIVNDGRLAGLIDWKYITDRTRNMRHNSHWTKPGDIIESAAESYQLDKWIGQSHHVEVWIEKDALIGVIEGVCSRLDVPFFSCRGYTSQSEMWGAGQRLARAHRQHKTPIVIHLGDHDPSGVDMTRDVQDRLELLAGCDIHVDRIALNMDQVEQYNPPPNPAKITDSRANGYIAKHGEDSWELDALEPAVMVDLIEKTIRSYMDEDLWQAVHERQEDEREQLTTASEKWDELVDYLKE